MNIIVYLLLLGTISVDFVTSAPSSASRHVNRCGRDVTGMGGYIDKSFNLPLKRVAQVLLADGIYTAQHKDVLTKPKYRRLCDDFYNITSTPWKSSDDDWMKRDLSFKRMVRDGNPLVKVASMEEYHVAQFTAEHLILSKVAKNMDTFTKGIEIEGEYCVTAVAADRIHLEVHMKVLIKNALLSLFSDSIEESSKNGFIEFYGSLADLLNNLAIRPEYVLEPLPFGPKELIIETATSGNAEVGLTDPAHSIPKTSTTDASSKHTSELRETEKPSNDIRPRPMDDVSVRPTPETKEVRPFRNMVLFGFISLGGAFLLYYALKAYKKVMGLRRTGDETRGARIALKSTGLE